MITRSEPAIKSGYSLSLQLFYNNALAIFGVMPMMALMVQSYNQGLHDQVRYCKNAFLTFSDPKNTKLLIITNRNQDFFNSTSLIGLDAVEINLKDLGYMENITQAKLEFELSELVKFLNSQMQ